MCDTILATPEATAAGGTLFGKNSDRQRNEAHRVELVPAAEHGRDALLKCTYLEIPQVPHTHAVLLCRPFWIWGAEMGANEKGVVIGNQSVHAREPPPQADALTGMDLIRLALERAASAAEAVATITELLERYGQGGNCGHLIPSYYNNGFIIADAREGFVLETIGREWMRERATAVRSISNIYSIGRKADATSAGLSDIMHKWTSEAEPDYAAVITNPDREHLGNAGARRACTTSLLRSRCGRLTVTDMMNILRDHGQGDRLHPEWAQDATHRRTVCMHAGNDDRNGQAVGSLVSEVHEGQAVHWVTGTSAPCVSIFKPVLFNVPLPKHGPPPTDRFDPLSLWWRSEKLYREAMMGDFAKWLELIRPERDALEADFRRRIRGVMSGGDREEQAREVQACWEEAMETQNRWHSRLQGQDPTRGDSIGAAWKRMSEIAGLQLRAQPEYPA